MRRGLLIAINLAFGVSSSLAMFACGPAFAQAEVAALEGSVSSTEEGAMEGVLVSAKKAGSTITVTVVSRADGHFAFPADRLTPGHYTLAIRAVGYDLTGPKAIDIPDQKNAIANLKLHKTADLAAQLTNSEWLQSIPGTDKQRAQLLVCVGCHKVERIMRSKYDSNGFFTEILPRMQSYVQQSIPIHPQLRPGQRLMEENGEDRIRIYRSMADYLSTLNLSATPKWRYELKTNPRPKGRATHVIYTEYDLPREDISPHDVMLDHDGIVWFSSFGEQNLGRLDPKTGKVTEFPYAESKPDNPTGSLGLRQDRDGNLWLGNMYQAAVVKFDRKTEKFRYWSLPAKVNIAAAQVNMVSPQRDYVDGKVWLQNNGLAAIHRLDIATGKFETWEPFKTLQKGEPHNIYDVIPDSKNNVYFTDFRQQTIGRIDAKTGKIDLFATPTTSSQPRRGHMDSQDRLWFGEYRGNRIGMFDTKTHAFKEWKLDTPWGSPYDAELDKNGDVWTGSMLTDEVTRLDTKSGKMVDYLLPRSTNIRRIFVDNKTNPVTVWVGSNHGASIVKIEPLD